MGNRSTAAVFLVAAALGVNFCAPVRDAAETTPPTVGGEGGLLFQAESDCGIDPYGDETCPDCYWPRVDLEVEAESICPDDEPFTWLWSVVSASPETVLQDVTLPVAWFTHYIQVDGPGVTSQTFEFGVEITDCTEQTAETTLVVTLECSAQ